jgi:hypothetical protein
MNTSLRENFFVNSITPVKVFSTTWTAKENQSKPGAQEAKHPKDCNNINRNVGVGE